MRSTHFASTNQCNFFYIIWCTGSPVTSGKLTDINIREIELIVYNFTQAKGEQEGKILANHLSEEPSKTQIFIHMN